MPGAGGRPTKYTAAQGHRLAELVRYGASLEDAAHSEGLWPNTVYRWTRSQREFRELLDRAKGDFVTQNLRHMNIAAMRGSWQASAWLLEHIVPDRFGKAATELPVVISLLLQKLPPETAGQVAAAWGIVGALSSSGERREAGGESTLRLSSGGSDDEPGS